MWKESKIIELYESKNSGEGSEDNIKYQKINLKIQHT